MKKKILCFIFALCFVFPLAFVLAGCLGNPEDPLTPEEQHKVDVAKHLNYVLEDLNNVSKNSTLIAGVDGSYTAELLENNQVEDTETSATVFDNVIVKLADGKMCAEIPTVGSVYFTDKYMAMVDADNSVNYDHLMNLNGTTTSEIALKLVNFKQIAELVTNFASTLDSDAVDFETKNNVTTVSVNINLKDLLDGIVKDYHLYKNEKISKFANAVLSRLAGKDVDIMASLNTIESKITAKTTIGDLIDLVGQEIDFDLSGFFKSYYDIGMSIYEPYLDYNENTEVYNYNGYIESGYNTIGLEGTYNDLMATKLTDLLEPGDSIGNYFDIIEQTIDSNDNTLLQTLLNNLDEETFTTVNDVLSAIKFNAVNFDIQFVLNSSNNLTNILVEANADIKGTDQTGKGAHIVADYDVTFSVNNVGSTEINPSFKNCEVETATFSISTTKESILSASGSEVKFLLDSHPINIESFTITGTYYDEEITFVSYSASTKILKINKEFLETELDEGNSCHEFDYYKTVTETDEYGDEYTHYYNYYTIELFIK